MNAVKGLVEVIYDIFIGMVTGIVEFFEYLPRSVNYVTEVVTYMPEELFMFLMASVTATVVLSFIGRTNG